METSPAPARPARPTLDRGREWPIRYAPLLRLETGLDLYTYQSGQIDVQTPVSARKMAIARITLADFFTNLGAQEEAREHRIQAILWCLEMNDRPLSSVIIRSVLSSAPDAGERQQLEQVMNQTLAAQAPGI